MCGFGFSFILFVTTTSQALAGKERPTPLTHEKKGLGEENRFLTVRIGDAHWQVSRAQAAESIKAKQTDQL